MGPYQGCSGSPESNQRLRWDRGRRRRRHPGYDVSGFFSIKKKNEFFTYESNGHSICWCVKERNMSVISYQM